MAVFPPAMSFTTSQKGKVLLHMPALAPARALARPQSSASSAIKLQGNSSAVAMVQSLAATITTAARMGTRRLLLKRVVQLRQGWCDQDVAVKPLTVLIEATIRSEYTLRVGALVRSLLGA